MSHARRFVIFIARGYLLWDGGLCYSLTMVNVDTPLKLLREALDRKTATFKRLEEERAQYEVRMNEVSRLKQETSEEIDQLVEGIMMLGGTGDLTPRR